MNSMTKKDLRIIFMGTPEFAVESLKRLVEGGYNVVAVVTQPDKPVDTPKADGSQACRLLLGRKRQKKA